MATIANLPNGKFKAIVKKDGRILKTKTFLKKSAAKAWARRIESDQEALMALGLPGTKVRVQELAKQYRDGNRRLDWFVKQIGPSKPITDVTADDVRAALEKFGSQNGLNTGSPRSPATYNRARALLSGMFKYAIQKGLLASNPVKPFPSKAERNKRLRYLSDDERTRLLEAARRSSWDRMELLIILAITTGARRSELNKGLSDLLGHESAVNTVPSLKAICGMSAFRNKLATQCNFGGRLKDSACLVERKIRRTTGRYQKMC